jgi:integrase
VTDMPRPRPPHLHREANRHGNMVWYVRVGKGPRIRIRAAYGTPEFEQAHQAALQGNRPRGSAKTARGTLGWLFHLYRQTSAWTDLAKSTRYKREKIMMRVLATADHQPVSAINEAAIIAGRERRAATPASAQAFIDTLHGLFKWAVSVKLAASDPTLNVKVKSKSKRKGGYPTWTDEDMAKFEARWPRGTRERVIFDILAYTSLRIGDVAILGRQHLKQRTIVIDGEPVRRTVISIDSEKTGMRVELPLLPQLKDTLDEGPPATSPSSSPGAARPGIRARWEPNSWRRRGRQGWSGNQPTGCARRPRRGLPRTGRPSANWRRSSAGRGADGDPLHQKREPDPACGGGHWQARPCRDRK